MKAGAAETRRGRSPTRKDFRKEDSEGQPLKEGEEKDQLTEIKGCGYSIY